VPAWGELLVALVCLVGIAGTIVPVLPGAFLVGGAILVWAVVEGSAVSWLLAVAAIGVIALGQVLKYLVPGRRMRESGVPGSVLVVGGLLGVVGFFVIPLVGLVVGFVGGVYLAEWWRLRSASEAWPTTLAAMKAAGLSMLIELASALIATSMWATVAVTT
jgi:uncharacterized protein